MNAHVQPWLLYHRNRSLLWVVHSLGVMMVMVMDANWTLLVLLLLLWHGWVKMTKKNFHTVAVLEWKTVGVFRDLGRFFAIQRKM